MYFCDVLEEEKEKVRRVAWKEGLAEGKAEGRAEGMASGLAEGRAAGLAEGRAEGKAAGLAEGRAEGIHSNAIENAKNLIKMKVLSNEQIAQATGLSVEEVQKLSSEQ